MKNCKLIKSLKSSKNKIICINKNLQRICGIQLINLAHKEYAYSIWTQKKLNFIMIHWNPYWGSKVKKIVN